ncbi:MAG: tripartite tricarboxylate transporter permease [Methanomicrobiaceae archaeon]|nr:tripartite tricarboxylate transporter permease [Methanomicrobiaceae archaeon]
MAPPAEQISVLAAILLGTLAGILLGAVSGLIPGIHVNTMAGILLAAQGILLGVLGPEAMGAALFAALITHTFLDIIPSTFLGIPDADTALSVLPAHALCLEGRGEEAVRLSALGSAFSVVAALPLVLVFFLLLPSIQPLIDWGIGIILIGVAGLLIVYSDSPEWSLGIFLVSGLLGLFVFHYPYLFWNTLGSSSVLMPLLAGLFGIAVLLASSRGEMPEQRFSGFSLKGGVLAKQSVVGACAGAAVGWLPGLSNATANAVLSLGMRHEDHAREYIVATSAANTANAFLGLAALYALSRTRNGVMAALAVQELPPVRYLLLAGLVAAAVVYALTVYLARYARIISGISIRPLSAAVIGLVTILSFVLCGPFGLGILALATAVGVVPGVVNVRRVACMGAIMLPVILMSFDVPV